jgi:hypothetical protein
LTSTPTSTTHPCVRCGRPVALDVALCELCNPLGLSDPASSQVHGTVVLAVILAVVGLAVAGRIALSGIGPFGVTIDSVASAGDAGLAVTITAQNQGSKTGSVSCTLTDPARRGGPTAIVRSPRIEAGETRTFTATVAQFGDSPRALTIVCDNP